MLSSYESRIPGSRSPVPLSLFLVLGRALHQQFLGVRGHRLFDDVSADELIEAAVQTGRYMTAAVRADGRVVYEYLARYDRGRNRYNILRHAGAAYSMLELYEVTGEQRYLALAKFFLDERGHKDCGRKLQGPYSQDHLPVTEQSEPVGHAVRAMYLYCGMADVAAYTRDKATSPPSTGSGRTPPPARCT